MLNQRCQQSMLEHLTSYFVYPKILFIAQLKVAS